MLNDIEAMVAARTTDEAWHHYVRRMAAMHFPHVSYHGARILKAGNMRLVCDSMLLSSYPARLIDELLAQGLVESGPMFRWFISNRGSESWDWMQARHQAGRLSPAEERALALFAGHGHTAGYAISLSDSVMRLRAGVLIGGAPGASQKALDRIWAEHGRSIGALTALLHLRLATLPYARAETLLTLRQREVLEAVSIGHTTREIAVLLDLTLATVEKHLRLARKALGARTTIQAIVLATSRRQIFLDQGEACAAAKHPHADGPPGLPVEPWTFTAFPSALSIAPGDGGQP